MDTRRGIMGHMVGCLMEDIGQKVMIQSEVVDGWIHLTGEVAIMGSILVLDQRDNIFIITIILTGGMRSNTFHMSSRKPSFLPLLES